MSRSRRIAVADAEPLVRTFYQETLVRLGHQVVGVAENGRQLVEQCKMARPELVITDIKMPDIDGLTAVLRIQRDRPTPVIVVTGFDDAELIARAELSRVMAYLTKPIKPSDLAAAIAIAVQRFNELRSVQRAVHELTRALEERKLIERAKGMLMRGGELDEKAAYRRLQKLARDKNVRMADVAEVVLAFEDGSRGTPRGHDPGTGSAACGSPTRGLRAADYGPAAE